MSQLSLEGLSAEQLIELSTKAKALAKKLKKAGIAATDADAIEIAGRIKLVAEKRNISTDKVIAAVKGALGEVGSGRKPSLRNVMRKLIEEDGGDKFANDVSTDVIAKDYIARFGQEKYEKLQAEYPPSPSAKYKK